MKKIISKNLGRNQNSSDSKLCDFSSLDFIILASTLAIALGEELSSNDINILATFFAVLSDELALIAAIDQCSSSDNSESFTAPTPDVAMTRHKISKSGVKNNPYKNKKKILKKEKKHLIKFNFIKCFFVYVYSYYFINIFVYLIKHIFIFFCNLRL